MKRTVINAANTPAPVGGYSQAVEVTEPRRILYISGQIPMSADGHVPGTFAEQARLAWQNVQAQLAEAGMGVGNIVKHTTFLSDRKYRIENREIRQEVFGDLSPALTVIIADIFDEAWLLEIEATAVA